MIAAKIFMLYDLVHDSLHDLVHDSLHDLVHDSAHEMEEEDYYCDGEISLNCYGLWYNGYCMFPNTCLFYEIDIDFSLPFRLIPKLFPSSRNMSEL